MYMDEDWLLGASGNDTTLGMYIKELMVHVSSLSKSEDMIFNPRALAIP